MPVRNLITVLIPTGLEFHMVLKIRYSLENLSIVENNELQFYVTD